MLLSTWQPGNGPSVRLTWEDLRLTPSGPDAVAVTGRFRFVTGETRAEAGSDTVRGVWTGLIARDGDRWAIVHEHESFANPPGNQPPQ
jgi:ketosteroid isomerase-like protein